MFFFSLKLVTTCVDFQWLEIAVRGLDPKRVMIHQDFRDGFGVSAANLGSGHGGILPGLVGIGF